MNQKELEKLRLHFKGRVEGLGFNRLVGLSLNDLQEGSCETELEVGPQHLNSNGWLHGGVMSMMSDVTAGFAAAAMGNRTTTVNMTTQYMRRGPSSGKIICKARVEKAGRTMIWTKSFIYNEKEELLCESTQIYSRLNKIDLDQI